MWLYRTTGRDAGTGDGTGPEPPDSGGLERYRTYGDFYDRYWSRMFGVTQADHDRLAERIRETRQAVDLTTVAKEAVLNRLQHGPQLNSRPAPNGQMPLHVARTWDPTAIWCEGDRAVVVVANPEPGRPYVARIGEIVVVADDHIIMQVDGIAALQLYALGIGGETYGRTSPEVAVAGLADAPDDESQVDYCLWKYGGHVVDRVLHALEADTRFVELEGRWFLADVARRPPDEDLVALARAMFSSLDAPVTPAELAEQLPRFAPQDVASRYGLLLAMRDRPDLFTNAGTLSRPRWFLAGPPPTHFFAERAVYDPDTFEVLCVPGETLSLAVARRLWDIGLLREALGGGAAPDRPSGDTRPPFDRRLSEAMDTPLVNGQASAASKDRRRRGVWHPLHRR